VRRTALPAIALGLFLAALAPAPAAPQAQPATALGFYARAEERRFAEEVYGAIDDYMAALALNPSYGEALAGLAECYYELEEYDQALSYATKAAVYRKGDRGLVDLEGFIRLGLGDLEGARARFDSVLAAVPNDLDGRFGLALLDLAAGKKTQARGRLEESLGISPQNARALVSLALIALDQARSEDAGLLVEKALASHPGDARVQLVAARVAEARGDRADAVYHARNAVSLQPARSEARSLLGGLLYASKDYEGAAAIMRDSLALDRKDASAWFTLGLAQSALGKTSDAMYSLETATGLLPDDEVARIALENLVIDTTPLEAPQRQGYADWHVVKGREYEDRSYFDQALIEYRRALRVYPYSVQGRTAYAELLRKRGFPARQLTELRFLESIGRADRSVLDAIETWTSLLSDSVAQAWGIDQYGLPKRPYKIAVFIQPEPGAEHHTDVSSVIVRYLTDILASGSRLKVLPLAPKVGGPSEAFRLAREAGADYYLMLSTQETDREIQLRGELRVGRTGSPAQSFRSYRTGNDRVKNTTVRLADLLVSSLQPKGAIQKRNQDRVLVDLGAADGLKAGDRLAVLKKGSLGVRNEGLGPSWPPSAVLGTLTITAVDEEASVGSLKSAGFFDTINVGDEIIALPAAPAPTPKGGAAPAAPKPAAEPEFPGLFTAVRQLR